MSKEVLLDRVCYLRWIRPGSVMHMDYKEGDIEEKIFILKLLYRELHERPGGDALYEKYYVDQTELINKLASGHRRYSREKNMIKERIARHFPHFLSNQYISMPTKLYLSAYMVSPDCFFLLFNRYKAARSVWDSLRKYI